MGKTHVGWRPERLREMREAHGLTLESAGEKLRDVARRARLAVPAANFQTLWQHEQGEVYPGPHYRRSYCLMYRATEPQLGFRNSLPGEETRPALTLLQPTQNGNPGLAVERALSQIAPGTAAADPDRFRQLVHDAWTNRTVGRDRETPSLVLIGGFAGSGKSEFARFITQLTGWALLDKDPITRPLVEQLLMSLGADPNDRHTELYRSQVRPLEYVSLLEAAYANIGCGISTVITAPFIAEMTDSAWMRRLTNRCQARGVAVSVVWIACDLDSMREYITFRSAARDAWKLQHWDDYAATIDVDLRPVVPHFVVDNRLGAAISLADQARQSIGAAGL